MLVDQDQNYQVLEKTTIVKNYITRGFIMAADSKNVTFGLKI